MSQQEEHVKHFHYEKHRQRCIAYMIGYEIRDRHDKRIQILTNRVEQGRGVPRW